MSTGTYLDPPEELPDVPEYLILQICQEWANDPPAWLREKADEYWIEKWEKKQHVHPWRK